MIRIVMASILMPFALLSADVLDWTGSSDANVQYQGLVTFDGTVIHVSAGDTVGGGITLVLNGSGTLTYKARGSYDGFYYACKADGTNGGYVRNEKEFKDYSLTFSTQDEHRILWATYPKGYIVNNAWGEICDVKWNGIPIKYSSLVNGLVAHYKFDGNAKDSSGNGHDGVITGGSFSADRYGNENCAYCYSGKESNLSTDNYVKITNSFTVSFWFRTGATLSSHGESLTAWNPGNYAFFPLHGGSDAGYGVKVGIDGIEIVEHGSCYLPTVLKYTANIGDKWRHVCLTVSDGDDPVLYLDGQYVATGSGSTRKKMIQVGTGLGGGPWGYYTGSIDEGMFYNRALSAAEVQALYLGVKPIVKVWPVSFDACGGVASQETKSVTNNTAIGELPTAERSGHKFLGWFTEATSGTQITEKTIITNNVTFFAHWFDTSFGGVTGATNVFWRTGGDSVWNTEEMIDGWTVKSGTIGKNGETWVECVVTNGCRVAYEWKVSCEPGDEGEMYDFLSFSIDGEQVDAICGDVDWTNGVFAVDGDGEHVLRWTYQKDYRTSEGEDCGWLGKVRIDPEVPVEFNSNGATSGEVPTIPTVYWGDAITIPGTGTLAKSCHSFGGWQLDGKVYSEGALLKIATNEVAFTAVWNAKVLSAPTLLTPVTPHVTTEKIGISFNMPQNATTIRYTLDGSEPTSESQVYGGAFEVGDRSVTVKAVAYADDWFNSACATWELARAPWSAPECLNVKTRSFTYDGNADWQRDLEVTHDGTAAMRSGTIDNKQNSTIKMSVTGSGTVSFWCKVSSECDPDDGEVYDGLSVEVDGNDAVGGLIGGEISWTNITISVAGDGEHIVSWRYEKDKTGSAGSDCAWIDELLWQADQTIVVAAETGSKDIVIGREWIERDLVDRYGAGKTAAFRDLFGSDYDLAVRKPNGKHIDGKIASVWQDYVAGTDPTDTNSNFSAAIEMVGGSPVVTWNPDLNEKGTKAVRIYKIWGKETLGQDSQWVYPTNSLHRFFKVSVEMP